VTQNIQALNFAFVNRGQNKPLAYILVQFLRKRGIFLLGFECLPLESEARFIELHVWVHGSAHPGTFIVHMTFWKVEQGELQDLIAWKNGFQSLEKGGSGGAIKSL
jgi:hypothetical protein